MWLRALGCSVFSTVICLVLNPKLVVAMKIQLKENVRAAAQIHTYPHPHTDKHLSMT